MKFVMSEDLFLQSYHKNRNNPLKILLGIYKGNYSKFLLSAVFYTIKHSPSWVMPLIISNVVNYVTDRGNKTLDYIYLNAVIITVLILLNIPMNYLHTHFRSRAVRYVEAGLRSSLVRKLQQLSISYHKEMHSGYLQSKVMRDVEAVENLSSQLFVSLLNIIINLSVALGITAFKTVSCFCSFSFWDLRRADGSRRGFLPDEILTILMQKDS